MRLQASGLWTLDGAGSEPGMRLVHAWPAFAWMTLRFHRPDASDADTLELTVSKRGLADEAWRELRICVARQLALSPRTARERKAHE